MVWIHTVSPQRGVATKTNDQLLDLLESMGTHGRNRNSASTIRAAFHVAARRGLITPEEAEAGIAIVLRIPVEKIPFNGAPM